MESNVSGNEPFSDSEFKSFAYDQIARIGKTLSSPKRLILLNVLSQGPHTVDELAQQSGMSVANTSRHLQQLKGACLVKAERDGANMRYQLASQKVAALFRDLKDVAADLLADLREAVQTIELSPTRAQGVDRDELLSMVEQQEALVVDVRPRTEYATAHISGSLSIPLDELTARLEELPRELRIVAYCRGKYCVLADKAVRLLKREGFDARRTNEDVVGWELDGLPVTRLAEQGPGG
jgi:rhodanese-related sulfurtransferase/DNA-binding transcriptional ArsR family regulator